MTETIEMTRAEFAAVLDADLAATADLHGAPVDIARKFCAGSLAARMRRFDEAGCYSLGGVRFVRQPSAAGTIEEMAGRMLREVE